MLHEDRCGRALRPLMLTCVILASAAAVSTDLGQQAATPSADVQHGRVLYLKHCAGCHGPRAWGDGPRVIPALAAQHEAYLISQLARFIHDVRPGSELHGPAMQDALQPPDVNRAQALRDLSAWLSQAAPNSEPEQGSGQALAAGKRAYANACAGCHGADGAGTRQGTPALASQHYSYLLGQLRGFSSGDLEHAPGIGPAALGPADQQQAIADYLSRLSLRELAGEK